MAYVKGDSSSSTWTKSPVLSSYFSWLACVVRPTAKKSPPSGISVTFPTCHTYPLRSSSDGLDVKRLNTNSLFEIFSEKSDFCFFWMAFSLYRKNLSIEHSSYFANFETNVEVTGAGAIAEGTKSGTLLASG